MASVYASHDRRRFFLVPDDVKLRAGGLSIQSLTGDQKRVDAGQILPYEVDEAAARQHVEGRLAVIEVLRRELLKFADALEKVGRDLSKEAPPERVAALLAMAGVTQDDLARDPAGSLKTVVSRLQSATMEALAPILQGPAKSRP